MIKLVDKCAGCNKEGQFMLDIKNYVVKYESWEAYNCCCARKCANSDGIPDDEIIEIE